jgi:hypothetical protein
MSTGYFEENISNSVKISKKNNTARRFEEELDLCLAVKMSGAHLKLQF